MERQPEDLVALALAFTRWAAERDLLSYPYTSPRSEPIVPPDNRDGGDGVERHAQPELRPVERWREALQAEFSDSLEMVRRTLFEKTIDFVGICPSPRALVITSHQKPTATQRNALPRWTTSRVQVHFEFAARPELRLASAAISPARTQVMRANRYPCGTSISLANAVSTGTMGALVEDGEGRIYGLTCNHVTGMCNNTPLGLQVVAPGLLDVRSGSLDPFTLGRHAKLAQLAIGLPDNIDIRDNVDAALFEVVDRKLVTSMQQSHYDTPTIIAPFSTEMTVEKVGRSTGKTNGRMVGWSPNIAPAPASVGSFKGTIYFEKVLLAVSRGRPFAELGDYGSLVVTEERKGKRHAIGIVYAVSSDRVLTYVAPIDEVLKQLKVKLVGGHNVASAPKPPGVP
ncbi:hypothetical protein [Sphingomonas bacterium]|uniref:hypothetical protein n=1 Tax=Sphingomonas bacterium TaxID=1895847 RepID=UPI00157558A1|nr:hypothetical protein [Sphingomonas bacterium]